MAVYSVFVGGVSVTNGMRSLDKAISVEKMYKKSDPNSHVVIREKIRKGRVTKWRLVDNDMIRISNEAR